MYGCSSRHHSGASPLRHPSREAFAPPANDVVEVNKRKDIGASRSKNPLRGMSHGEFIVGVAGATVSFMGLVRSQLRPR
jgi:hypothetical protein